MSENGWKESQHPRPFRAGQRPMTLRIISPVASWYSHRIDGDSRPIRCGGARCKLCGDYQRLARAVVLCLDRSNNEWFLYLTERNRKVFEGYPTLAGLIVQVWKRGPASNSPLEIRIAGTHDNRIRDIEALCAHFDQAARLIEDAPALEVAI
jgi:hypothetical protein